MLTVVLAARLPVGEWSTSLMAMMLIGTWIDDVLLPVTRFREWHRSAETG
jgi:RND superfamily putative drug exporter